MEDIGLFPAGSMCVLLAELLQMYGCFACKTGFLSRAIYTASVWRRFFDWLLVRVVITVVFTSVAVANAPVVQYYWLCAYIQYHTLGRDAEAVAWDLAQVASFCLCSCSAFLRPSQSSPPEPCVCQHRRVKLTHLIVSLLHLIFLFQLFVSWEEVLLWRKSL